MILKAPDIIRMASQTTGYHEVVRKNSFGIYYICCHEKRIPYYTELIKSTTLKFYTNYDPDIKLSGINRLIVDFTTGRKGIPLKLSEFCMHHRHHSVPIGLDYTYGHQVPPKIRQVFGIKAGKIKRDRN